MAIYSDYIKLPTSNSRGSNTDKSKRAGIVNASRLNVRSGPGTNYKRIGQLNRNTKVSLLSHNNGWYRIQYGAMKGYVSDSYIR